MSAPPHEPAPQVSLLGAVMLIAGVVIGAGIFALPSLVAANTGSGRSFLLAWVAGGAVSLAGALCYAELATTYPHAGGEHHFLRRAFGPQVGFLFAWSRMTVLQTGSIAIQAYIVGEYLAWLVPRGANADAVFAGSMVVAVTALNLAGIRWGNRVQVVLGLATCVGLVLVAAVGFIGPPTAVTPLTPGVENAALDPAFGLAMVFVLLAFGGWNEAAYISADVTRRAMVRALVLSIGLITAIYLLVNLAYLRGLGMAGIAASDAVAADLVAQRAGPGLAALTSAAISIAALSTMNATAITGARSNLALGRDVPLFRRLGVVHGPAETPRNAFLVQGTIALLLIGLGVITRDAFRALVEYTAPVFWCFFFLVGASLFVLRRKDPSLRRPFRVPLYPLTPLIFCGMCLYMIRSSLAHTGAGALVGVAVLLAGVPLLWFVRGQPAASSLLHPKQT